MRAAPRWISWMLRSALVAVPVGLVTFLVFLALAYASLGVDRGRLTAQVRTGFATGELQGDKSWLFGDTNIGVHQWVDCLILFQTIDDRAPSWQRAISPLSVPIDTDYSCARLQTLVTHGADTPPRPYHQYLHAHTTLARALVPAFGVRGTRELYKLILMLLALTGIAYAGAELTRGRRRGANAVWLVIFLAFARLFGFETFGQSLSHGPSDAIVLGFLLFVSRASAAGPVTARTAILAAAVFGALTMEFEFLTGGLPLGLALVLGALPLALRPDKDLGPTVAGSAFAFAAAAATCVVAKLAMVAIVFGPAPLMDMVRQLLFRVGIEQAAARDQPATGSIFFSHIWAGLDALAPGMQWLVVGGLVLALIAGGWGYRRLRASAEFADRAQGIALAGSTAVVPVWLVLFWQHTAEHAWFMDRLFVWPIASGAALFVLALCRRPPDREPSHLD